MTMHGQLWRPPDDGDVKAVEDGKMILRPGRSLTHRGLHHWTCSNDTLVALDIRPQLRILATGFDLRELIQHFLTISNIPVPLGAALGSTLRRVSARFPPCAKRPPFSCS